jgi:maltose-binding protein MalE
VPYTDKTNDELIEIVKNFKNDFEQLLKTIVDVGCKIYYMYYSFDQANQYGGTIKNSPKYDYLKYRTNYLKHKADYLKILKIK